MVTQTVRLSSLEHFGRRVPPDGFGDVIKTLKKTARGSIRMAVEGRSASKGALPTWLKRSADIRFIDLDGEDDTLAVFECPLLGDAAEDLYDQPQLPGMETLPDPELTGLDLLGLVFADVEAGNEDSGRFDRTLLRHIGRFGSAFKSGFDDIMLEGTRADGSLPTRLTSIGLETARGFADRMPASRPVNIVGVLDMIRASTRAFEILIENGLRIHCVLEDDDMGVLTDLFESRVLVRGEAEYRPSGKLLRVSVESVEDGANAPAVWSAVPPPLERRDHADVRQVQTETTGVNAFFGAWPGEESDTEFRRMLEEVE